MAPGGVKKVARPAMDRLGAGVGSDVYVGNGNDSGADYRLISYVAVGDETAEDSRSREQQRRDIAGEAGVDLVVAYLRKELRASHAQVEKMPEGNKGYDILVSDKDASPRRYVEVKLDGGQMGCERRGAKRGPV